MDTEDLAESRLLADTDEEVHAGNSHTQQTPSTSNEPADIGAAFTLFQSYLDKKLVALKDDLREESSHTTDFVASKIKETSELSCNCVSTKVINCNTSSTAVWRISL